jgi:flagellar protein FlaJ
MAVIWLVPLAFAIALVSPLFVERYHEPTHTQISQVALALFGDYVGESTPRHRVQQRKLRAAHVGTTHRVYASRTLLYSLLFGISGSVVGVYAAALLLWALHITGSVIREALPPALGFLAGLTHVQDLGGGDLFVLLLVSSGTLGALLAAGTYWLRWRLLDQRAKTRATEIEATLPRTIAFVYALSRSGMAFPAILATLTQHRRVYGEAAAEVGVAVREMETFGTDVLTALDRMAERSPSEGLSEFGENLAAVLGSGRSISSFLHEQYDRYQKEAASQQSQYLELLATFAEAYVSLLVVGPLLLITILAVVGLVLQDTLRMLRIVVYLAVPTLSLAFVLYIDSVTTTLTDAGSTTHLGTRDPPGSAGGVTDVPAGPTRTDGGADASADRWQVSRERLQAYTDFERTVSWLRQPGRAVLRNPWASFLLTVPLGLAWVAFQAGSVPLDPLGALRAIDTPVVEALLFALVVYTGVYEWDKRRLQAIERAVPDFLERFASVNDAGASVVASFERLAHSEMGALTPELQRTWRDVEWGADVQTALRRMDRRIQSATVSRATTLATNAMSVSGDIGPVLEIAADEARATRRLRRERSQEMLTYLVVIYISFLVFIAIIGALTVSFVPAIEAAGLEGSAGGLPEGVSAGALGGIQNVDTGAYELLFFHTAVIQAVCSGLVAGQLGEGRVADGVKHAVVLLLFTLVTFAVI